MSFINKIEGTVVPGDRLDKKLGFPTITVEISKKQTKNLQKGVSGAMLFMEGHLYYGVMQIGNVNDSLAPNRQVEFHVLNDHPLTQGTNVLAYEMFYLREERKFPTLLEWRAQIQKDLLEVKTRLGLYQNVSLDAPVLHLPDLLFTKIINDSFGINRGILNTMDAWFWKRGVTSIESRRTNILTFLRKNASPTAKVALGAGQLTRKLEQYWNEKNAIYQQSILL